MTPPPPLPPNGWDALPVEVQGLIQVMELQIEAIQRQIDALQDPVRPVVIEYQTDRLTCPRWGVTTRPVLPEGVPAGSFGPDFMPC